MALYFVSNRWLLSPWANTVLWKSEKKQHQDKQQQNKNKQTKTGWPVGFWAHCIISWLTGFSYRGPCVWMTSSVLFWWLSCLLACLFGWFAGWIGPLLPLWIFWDDGAGYLFGWLFRRWIMYLNQCVNYWLRYIARWLTEGLAGCSGDCIFC